jgi:hypothetical protein
MMPNTHSIILFLLSALALNLSVLGLPRRR